MGSGWQDIIRTVLSCWNSSARWLESCHDRRDNEAGTGAEIVTPKSPVPSRRLRDRFSAEDLQVMINLYRSGTTARQVAEMFGVSVRSVTRLLHKHGVRRGRPASIRHSLTTGTKQPRVV